MPFENSPSSSLEMEMMKRKLSMLETEHGRKAGLVSLVPKPDDVFIVTPPKCGTTLVCQIVHSLRTGGDMNFEEINLEIPCLEMAYDYGYTDINAPQAAHPRVFKTHAWKHHCPWLDEAKYIYVVRDPLDAGPSFYHFLEGWFFYSSDIPMDDFIKEFFLARGKPSSIMQNASHWHNMASWYEHRKDDNVLWLFYEEILQDLRRHIDIIADFLGLAVGDTALRDTAAKQSHIDHMKQYPTKYDEHMLKEARNIACGLHPRAGLDGTSAGKVRQGGRCGGKSMMSDEVIQSIQQKWVDVMLPVTGYGSYDEFRKGVEKELRTEK